jgi:hypothetical protein
VEMGISSFRAPIVDTYLIKSVTASPIARSVFILAGLTWRRQNPISLRFRQAEFHIWIGWIKAFLPCVGS